MPLDTGGMLGQPIGANPQTGVIPMPIRVTIDNQDPNECVQWVGEYENESEAHMAAYGYVEEILQRGSSIEIQPI